MKLAVLADIHANYVALQTLAAHIEAWQPDLVIVAGDVVNRGPCPLECLRFVQDKQRKSGWLVVRGNHENYVIGFSKPDAPRNGAELEVHRHSYWTYRQLDGNVSTLAAMPFEQSLLAPDGGRICITHASMGGIREGIYPENTDDELRRKIRFFKGLFCVGHTHRPLIRHLDGALVVNVGSAGLPFDGDRRAAYAQLSWHGGRWQAKIVRLEYDWQQAEHDFYNTSFLDGSGPLGLVILNEFHTARSHLYYWTSRYQDRVLAGELTMEDSVQEFLAGL